MKQSFNDIEHLIVKSLFGTLSEEEQQQLDLWKEESPEHVALYDKMVQERNLSVSYRQYREIRTQRGINSGRGSIRLIACGGCYGMPLPSCYLSCC